MALKPNLPRYPDPSRVDGGRSPQSATLREAGKSFDFYACIILTCKNEFKPTFPTLHGFTKVRDSGLLLRITE